MSAKNREGCSINLGKQLTKERNDRPHLKISGTESYPTNMEKKLAVAKARNVYSNVDNGQVKRSLLGFSWWIGKR